MLPLSPTAGGTDSAVPPESVIVATGGGVVLVVEAGNQLDGLADCQLLLRGPDGIDHRGERAAVAHGDGLLLRDAGAAGGVGGDQPQGVVAVDVGDEARCGRGGVV